MRKLEQADADQYVKSVILTNRQAELCRKQSEEKRKQDRLSQATILKMQIQAKNELLEKRGSNLKALGGKMHPEDVKINREILNQIAERKRNKSKSPGLTQN